VPAVPRSLLATTAALCLLLAACGGGDSELDDAAPLQTEGASEEPSDQETQAAAGTTGAVPPGCEDPAGDTTGALDLTSVIVSKTDDKILFTYVYSGTVPTTGSMLFSVLAGTKQYGYKQVDGKESAHFIFDFSASRQENVEDAAEVGPTETSATFAADDVDLAKLTGGIATINIEGTDIDGCQLR
jgi:hypothetical protein